MIKKIKNQNKHWILEKDKNVKLNKQSKKESYKCENINNISNFIIKSPENISSKDIVTFINKNYVPKLDLNNEEKRKMNKLLKRATEQSKFMKNDLNLNTKDKSIENKYNKYVIKECLSIFNK